MFEEIKKQFDKVMKKSGMEWVAETDKERFEGLMEKGGMAELEKSVIYIAKLPSRLNPDMEPVIMKFTSRKERSDWYNDQGKKLEETFGIKIEMPAEPVPGEIDKK